MSSNVSDLQPGAIAYGRSGLPFEVLECHANWVRLRRPDATCIEVHPTAIIRWENPKNLRAESNVKISSEPSELKNESLQPLLEALFAPDDMSEKYRPKIVRKDKVSSEDHSIVRRIVREKTFIGQGLQQFSDSSDGSDDIFKPLSAQQKSENFVPVVNNQVRLKGTDQAYTLLDIYEVVYLVGGEQSTESWAKLKAADRSVVHWKLSQLILVSSMEIIA